MVANKIKLTRFYFSFWTKRLHLILHTSDSFMKKIGHFQRIVLSFIFIFNTSHAFLHTHAQHFSRHAFLKWSIWITFRRFPHENKSLNEKFTTILSPTNIAIIHNYQQKSEWERLKRVIWLRLYFCRRRIVISFFLCEFKNKRK